MLIIVQSKDSQNGYVGIPAGRIDIDTDNSMRKRVYVLIPRTHTSQLFCEVEIATEESDRWTIIDSGGKEMAVDSIPLLKSDDALLTELNDVWDDGASNHMGKAKHLYEMFSDQINKHRQQALSIKRGIADSDHAIRLEQAKERGWETDSISQPVITDEYGEIPG